MDILLDCWWLLSSKNVLCKLCSLLLNVHKPSHLVKLTSICINISLCRGVSAIKSLFALFLIVFMFTKILNRTFLIYIYNFMPNLNIFRQSYHPSTPSNHLFWSAQPHLTTLSIFILIFFTHYTILYQLH